MQSAARNARSTATKTKPASFPVSQLINWFLVWNRRDKSVAHKKHHVTWFCAQSFYQPIQNLWSSETHHLCSFLRPPKIPLRSRDRTSGTAGCRWETLRTSYQLQLPKGLSTGHIRQDCRGGTATLTSLEQRASCYSPLKFEMAAPNPFQQSGIFLPHYPCSQKQTNCFHLNLHARAFSLTQTPAMECFEPRKSGKIIIKRNASDKIMQEFLLGYATRPDLDM